MNVMNLVCLTGRIARQPEIRTTQSGKPVARFAVAVTRDVPPGEDGRRPADFPNCVMFGRLAERLVPFMSVGRLVELRGTFATRSFTTENGRRRKISEVVVNQFRFLDKHTPDAGPAKVQEEQEEVLLVDEEQGASEEMEVEEIPF